MGFKTLLWHKLKALLIHLGISVVIFLPFLYLIWFHWYPAPLFFTDGGWQGLRIMALVDLVLGPSLTFLIFNPSKSRRALSFDFTCIALAQAAALVYGVYTVQSVRPWTMAYYDGALHVMTRETYADQEVAPGTWERVGDGPLYRVFAREPQNDEESAGVAAFDMLAGVGPEGLAYLYEPLAPHLETVKAAAMDMALAIARAPQLKPDYEALLQRHEGEPLWFLPLYGYFASVIVALDAQGEIVDTLYHEPPVLVTPDPPATEDAPAEAPASDDKPPAAGEPAGAPAVQSS